MFDDYLISVGEKPFNTEKYIVVDDDWKKEHGVGIFRYALEGEVGDNPQYQVMNGYTEEIDRRFRHRYAGREIGAETDEAFLANLIVFVEKFAPLYEHSFRIYNQVDTMEIQPTSTNKGRTVYQDTPNGELSGTYATNVTDTEDTSVGGDMPLRGANSNIREYRYLINDFIEEFEPCFMDTVARI